jgi:predicted MFS family arabinose efflux permease
VLDAVSFVLAAVLVAGLLPRSSTGTSDAKQPQRRRGAYRLLLGDDLLRLVVVTFAAGTITAAATQSVLVVAAQQRFGGASVVGWLYSAVGAGALTATLVLVKRPVRLTRPKLSVTAFAMIAPLALLSVVHQLWMALVLLVITEAAGVSVEIWGNSDIQERTPAADLPRANAALFSIWYLGMLIGALGALVLAPIVGWNGALAVMCGVAALLVFAGLPPVRHRSHLPSPLADLPD